MRRSSRPQDRDRQLLHPEQVRQRVAAGENPEALLQALGADSDRRFYADFSDLSMAAQGERLVLAAELPRVTGAPVSLGSIDGDAADVDAATRQHGMGPYWNYLGHRYSREWIRELKAGQAVRVTMTLLEPASRGVLTAEPVPVVDGKVLRWELMPGEVIRFHDGRELTSKDVKS